MGLCAGGCERDTRDLPAFLVFKHKGEYYCADCMDKFRFEPATGREILWNKETGRIDKEITKPSKTWKHPDDREIEKRW